jgi:uncharacterized membrane protein YbaN (DUF454 family)
MAITANFSFREHWEQLKQGRPGRRFQERYRRARTTGKKSGTIRRIATIGAAAICLAIGVVLSVMPGPAILFFFLAGGLLATESKWIARFMDWLEVRIRSVVKWGKRHWDRWSTAERATAAAVAASVSAAAVYVMFQFFRG